MKQNKLTLGRKWNLKDILTDRLTEESYTNKKISEKDRKSPENVQSTRLKKFQQYFNLKEEFPIEFRNIFQSVKLETRDGSPIFKQNEYKIKPFYMKHRSINLQTNRRQLRSEDNNFQIEPLSAKQIYKKATLNKLIDFKCTLKYEDLSKRTQEYLQQNLSLLKDMKESMRRTARVSFRYGNNKSNHIRIMHKTIKRQENTSDFQEVNHAQENVLNPFCKTVFTAEDIIQTVLIVNHIKIQPMISSAYFNVYVEDGNNSELVKFIVRKRSGWRIVEIPDVANLIWTQFYKKPLLENRLNRKQKIAISNSEEEGRVKSVSTLRTKIITSNKKRYQGFETQRDASRQPHAKNSQNQYKDQITKLLTKNQRLNFQYLSKLKSKVIPEIIINHNFLIHNHFPEHKCISDKKHLHENLKKYYLSQKLNPHDFLPETYQIVDLKHPILQRFRQSKNNLNSQQKKNEIWIIKPGQNSNRGKGIVVCHGEKQTYDEIERRVGVEDAKMKQKQCTANNGANSSLKSNSLSKDMNSGTNNGSGTKNGSKSRSLILQQYLNPLLYNRRKFDIRSYMLVTLIKNQIRVYTYEECYIRTSSKIFDLASNNKYVHLTNDAIQSHSNQYGKFQEGNKISEESFSKYINDLYQKETHLDQNTSPKEEDQQKQEHVWKRLKEEMNHRCVDIIRSVKNTLFKGCFNSEQTNNTIYFEHYGLDFMIDLNYKLWLIEVNTNPSITHQCSRVLNSLIPPLIDNVLVLAVEPYMTPIKISSNPYNNRFKVIYSDVLTKSQVNSDEDKFMLEQDIQQ